MADTTNDRGSKPPRTMFSLGRPGARAADAGPDAVPDAAPESAELDQDSSLLVDSGYLCGACEAPLPVGAAYCGQCATPVAGMVPDTAFTGDPPVDEFDDSVIDGLGTATDQRSPLTDLEVPDDAALVEPTVVPDADPPADPAPDADAAPADVRPAAVLYADREQAEPLPAPPTGSWGISAPSYGTAEGDFVSEPDVVGDSDPGPQLDDPVAAAAAAAAAAGVIAVPLAAPDEVAPTADPYAAPIADPYAAPLGDPSPPSPDTGTHAGPVVAGAAVGAGIASSADDPLAVLVPPTAPGVVGTPPRHTPAGADYMGDRKSKTPMILAGVGALVVILILAVVLLAKGGGNDAQLASMPSVTNPAAKPTTPSSSSAAGETTTSIDATTTVVPDSVAPETTAATVPQTTAAAPVTAAPPVTPRPTTPVTTVAPGRIEASVANGTPRTIPRTGTFAITFTNTGDLPAQCQIGSSSPSEVSLEGSCGPSIPAHSSVTVTVRGNIETRASQPVIVSGVIEGIGRYSISVSVTNA